MTKNYLNLASELLFFLFEYHALFLVKNSLCLGFMSLHYFKKKNQTHVFTTHHFFKLSPRVKIDEMAYFYQKTGSKYSNKKQIKVQELSLV